MYSDKVIYVLEDLSVASVSSLLEWRSYGVLSFNSVVETMLAVKQRLPDLILVDIDWLQQNQTVDTELLVLSVPVIRLSNKSDLNERLSAVRAGCKSLISKPVQKNILLTTVENYLDYGLNEPYKILMVDDDPATIESQAALLSQLDGVVVEKLTNPLDCLDVLNKFNPDLILLDMLMPGIDGIELSKVIRQIDQYNYVPIIFLSSMSDPEMQEQALQNGGEYFITKPVDADQFKLFIKYRLKYARKAAELYKNLLQTHLVGEKQRETLDKHAIVSAADIQGNITYVNDKFCEISGYSRNELLGNNHRIIKSEQHDDEFYQQLWKTISSGNVWHGVICNLRKDKSEYWVDSTITPFLDVSGKPYQYVSVRTDITQLMLSERRLALSHEFAEIGTWDWNIKTGDLFWSEQIAPLFGYDSDVVETTYENFVAAIHPEDREKVQLAVRDCVEKDIAYNVEHRVVWQDGTVRWLSETGNVTKNRKNEAVHMLGVVQDITTRKNWQQKLAESESLARAQLDSMSEGMFGLDSNNQITFVNQAACAMLGYGQDEFVGRQISDLVSVTDVDAKEIGFSRSDDLQDIYFSCSDGHKIPVEYSSMPLLSENSVSGEVITFKDISDRKRAQQELLESKEAAEKANRAKSQFLSSMSHELRTPLNAIIGFSQLLELDSSNPLAAQQKDNVKEILRAGNHLLELINEVLDLSKIEAGQTQMSIEPVKLADVLIDCVSLIAPVAERHSIQLNFNRHNKKVLDVAGVSDSVLVLADKLRLKQVFLNLISNAIKYNCKNGSVDINCNLIEDNICRIEIKDTGDGISAEEMKNLFQPFNRMGHESSSIEGTGIGLVITKNLVEMMGGEIKCLSEKGRGTTFSVELSLAQTESVSDLAVSERVFSKDQYHLLYIEDNPVNIRLMAQVFSKEKDLHLSTVHEPVLGLNLVEEEKPDMVLLDINLPGMNGYKVLEKLHQLLGEDFPVIAVSANSSTFDIKQGLDAGFIDYITKPIDIDNLIKTTRRVLNDHCRKLNE